MNSRYWARMHDKRIGHYERSKDGRSWDKCARDDAARALGSVTARELQRCDGVARSEWGMCYRYVRHNETLGEDRISA